MATGVRRWPMGLQRAQLVFLVVLAIVVGSAVAIVRSEVKPGMPSNPTGNLTAVNEPVSGSEPKVFAHYFPPYPISLDNLAPEDDYYSQNYLRPEGEGGKFRDVGGLLRDRPEGRAPLVGNFRMADAITEVEQAAAAGIDGFNVNIMAWSGESWDTSLRIADAAGRSDSGLVVVPNIDMSTDAANASIATMASQLALYYSRSAAFRLPDERFVLSIFYAEARPAAFYRGLINELRDAHQIDVAWSGIFNSLSDAQIDEYAPISYSLGIWGVRSAPLASSLPNHAAAVHAYGVKWVAPIAVQDVRHRTLSFAESGNMDLLRATWARAINDNADFAQLVTWNDYSESTGFSPSVSHQSAFLDLNGYYLKQFKSGSRTTLTGDELIVTHRIQKTTTKPRLQMADMDPTLSGSSTPPRDTVEVICLCSSGAIVTLTMGVNHVTYHAPAGVSHQTMPLGSGTISAQAVRDGQVVATVKSPHPVASAVDYWNLQYYAVSSRQNPN